MTQSVTLVILEPDANTDPRDATIRCLLAELRLLRSALEKQRSKKSAKKKPPKPEISLQRSFWPLPEA